MKVESTYILLTKTYNKGDIIMKIKVEFEIREMDKMHYAMLEGAKELEVDAPDSLFVKRNIDLTSIKINQNIVLCNMLFVS